MDRKIFTKVLAAVLAFTLTFANVYILGIYTKEAIAASLDLERQSVAVDNANIEFDAYFKEEGQPIHTKEIDVAKNNEKLYLNIKVSDGYLANGEVKIENANFKLEKSGEELEAVQSIDVETNTITLNQINKDESVILELEIKMNTDSDFDVQNIDRVSSVVLEGTFVKTERTLLNEDIKEVKISKTIEVNSKITAEATSNIEAEVLKYAEFDINGKKGVILQTLVKSNVVDNILPVKQTELEIEIPEINDIKPNEIILSSNSYKAANGKVLTSSDYTYEDGKVKLVLENKEENGKISWMKDAQDEIILTCIYGEELTSKTGNITIKANNAITLYDAKASVIKGNVEENITLSENIGQIVSYGIFANETKLQKGYMLASGADNTPYVETISANIGYKEAVDSIVLEGKTKYVDANGNKYSATPKYTYTKILEENFLGILGEDGYVSIYNKDGEKITTLNKDNLEYKYEEDVNYIRIETSKPITEGIINIENGREILPLEYSKTQENLFVGIVTSVSGKVILNNSEILKGEDEASIELEAPKTQASLTLSKENISTVVTNEDVEIRATLKTTDSSTVLYKNPTIEIEFPSYVTDISANNVRLMYEDELKFSKAEMYTNANGNKTIRIGLVGEQTSFNKEALVEGATLVMKANITVDELTPSRTEYIKTYVKNELTGELVVEETPMKFVAPVGMVTVNQISNFNEKGTVATSISGKTEVGELETKSTAKIAEVKMTVINNYTYNCENIVILGRTPFEGNKDILTSKDLGSTFTAKMVSSIKETVGVTDDKVTVYYSANGEANTDLNDAQNGWTENAKDLSEIKSFMIVLNDFTLNTGDTIGFNYNVEIPEGLNYDKSAYGVFAVYYNKQDTNVNSSLSQVSSVRLASRDISGLRLAANTPIATQTQVASATQVGVSTGQGPDLKAELIANVDDKSEVEEGQIITYTAKVTNNLDRIQDNVVLVVEIPSGSYFVTDDGEYIDSAQKAKITVGSIEAKETKTVEFRLKSASFVETSVGDSSNAEIHFYDANGNEITEQETNTTLDTTLTLEDFGGNQEDYNEYLEALEEYAAWQREKEELQTNNTNINKMTVKVAAQVEGYDDTFESNELINTVIKQGSELKIQMDLSTGFSKTLTSDRMIEYGLSIDKNVLDTLNNVVIETKLPDGLSFSSASKDGTYDESTRTVTWKFDTLDTSDFIALECKIDKLENNVYEKEIPLVFTAKCSESDKTFTSNTLTIKVVGEGFSLAQTSNISDGYLTAGEEITYVVTVKNLSSITVQATITDSLPSELSFVQYYYTQNEVTTRRDNNSGRVVNIPVTLDAGETLTIYLTAKANNINAEAKEITNNVVLNSTKVENLEANAVTHRLMGSNYVPGSEDNGDNQDGENTTYRISGVAWLDSNKNGKRDDGEELKSGIKVLLLDSSTNNIVARTETNENGVYVFLGVKSGRYVVAFDYDTLNYDVTTYRAENVDASVNSDAINMTLNIDENLKKYAATDIIVVSSNSYNIDLGLVISPKFDLELTKAVTLMQVSNAKGSETHTFGGVQVAKLEIPGKDMNGTVVAITYTFTVENTGAVPGYAKKIVDYIPNDLSFSSNLNPEWYQDTDGNLYNVSLSNRLINPGEKVELNLVLTKTMTDENTGVVNNTAEIYEASNDQGIDDIDSTPGNRNANEDDYGIADAIITVKTGGPIIYTGIVLAVLVIFTLGGYEIKKKVLTRI